MNTLEELKQLIHQSFGIDPATLTADGSLSDYGLDSLALGELLFSVEDHFDLTLPDTRTEIKSLESLAALIDELKAQKAS